MQSIEHIQERQLFLFNPTSEMAIANGEIAWQPNQTLQQFEKDLELLPYLFAKDNDILIVDEIPSKKFINKLKTIKDCSPEFIRKSEIRNNFNLQNLSLQPWGWSPAAHHFLKPLKSKTSEKFRKSLNYQWDKQHKEIVSRQFSTKILNTIISKNPSFQYLPIDRQPLKCSSIIEVEMLSQKWGKIVLKAPWSSSGRGVQMLRQADLNASNRQWISGIIKQQGYIMVEPLLEKQEDFSLQFHISPKGIQFLGVGKFNTNSNGQYIDNLLNPSTQFIKNIIPIEDLVSHVSLALESLNTKSLYEGFAGVDLMTIKDENESLIHPCVEVNWRYNMGLVALQLQKLIHPEAKGKFSVFFNPKKRFREYADEAIKKYPIQQKNGKLIHGFVPLSDPDKSVSGAYILLD